MNADVRNLKTDAEQALSAAYVAARGSLPGKGAVATLREEAYRKFDASGLPHRRLEEWKYTDLRALVRNLYPLAAAPDAAARDRVKHSGKLGGVDCRRLVFVDGAFAPDLSDLSPEQGVTVSSMAEALAKDDPLVAAHVGKTFETDDIAVALNTALMGDGAVIRVSAGTQPKRAIDLVAEDEAQVDYIKITQTRALHIASLLATIGARAQFNTFSFTAGAQLVRNQCCIRFAGEGTKAAIRGVSLLRGKDHVDTTLPIEHAAGHCESREQFKAVLDAESHSVFQGKIVVKQHAQKTDAKMMTRELLLSDEAEADNKPELEIFADDVVCGHGATAGALDPGLKFYLMSRGIHEKEAEALLVQAFIGETIEEIAHEGIREALMIASLRWLGGRS